MPMNTWVLVADGSRARLLTREKSGALTEAETFVCPETRLKDDELISDRAGRSFDSRGSGRHGMEPRTSQHDQVAMEFARQIAGRLEELRVSGQIEKLVLIAAPAFLGQLRAKLSDGTSQLVALSIDKDLSRQDLSQIEGQIPKFF
jgi:protein required for attachment to host cells